MIIPSMGGSAIGKQLREWAQACEDGTAIIELGTWLGAGTQEIGQAIESSKKDIELHSYDCFEIHGNEVDKARAWGVTVKEKQDTLPLVKEYLSGIKAKIFLHKGEILDTKWSGRKIAMQVDDACKHTKEFQFAIKTFSPFWIPGKTILVLMDYYWHEWRPTDKDALCQPIFIEENKKCFQSVWEWKKYAVKAFLYLGGELKI